VTYRIVIAEDETVIRNNLARLLRIEGFDVVAGANGREALELVRQHRPDLLLSDVMMPEMNGHELVKAIRSDPYLAHIPAVMLTARADRTDIRIGMNLGADDYLTKPFQRDELLLCIRSQLDKVSKQKQATQRLVEQAHRITHYDPVTDLPNRTHVTLLLDNLLRNHLSAHAALTTPAVIAVGMLGLREIAEVLGSNQYDIGVQALAKRLTALTERGEYFTGHTCLVGRFGDNRLVVVVPDWPTDRALDALAERLHDRLSEPMELAGQEIFPSVSVGACTSRAGEVSAQALFNRLEVTLAAARIQKNRRVAVYKDGMAPDMSQNLRLHNDLHRAVGRNELRAYFQPQISAIDGSVVGFEALVRWQHADLGLIPPLRFIPLAEDNGQIVHIGAWMLMEACTQAQRWRSLCEPNQRAPRVAVNLSARQFSDPRLVEHVQTALEASDLPPEMLELEITEGTAMADLQGTLDLLTRFKGMGVTLAIDDFGTGYSSLAYLKRFPLDVLKIDQSFIRQICTEKEDRAISAAVITLAHSLDLRVVAEGVETAEQHQLLSDMGCDQMQGFLHAKPMPAEEVDGWLRNHYERVAA
jgi:EAL domain-containing protein (putative c-di-GMP-specific phosphodiesterase class I)/PleD family two-component response regulator